MRRTPSLLQSSSRPFVSSYLIGDYALILSFLFVLNAVASGFTACPFACSNRFIGGFIANDDSYVVVGGSRTGFHRRSMTNDDSVATERNSLGFVHHTAVKTRNITTAIQFYSLLGFHPTAKFKAGPARAAWLEQQDESSATSMNSTLTARISRIELIEVPHWILEEPEGMRRRAFDLFKHQEYLGHNHMAFDVSSSIDANKSDLQSLLRNSTFLLSAWMETINKKSLQLFGKTLRVALEAEQFMVGSAVYERAFIYDADGALIELLYKAAELPQQIDPMSGWELYDWYEKGDEIESRNDGDL